VQYFDTDKALVKEWERVQADYLATLPNEDDEQ
jgi:hypothetical protein